MAASPWSLRLVARLAPTFAAVLLLVGTAQAVPLGVAGSPPSDVPLTNPADRTEESLYFQGVFVTALSTGLSHAGTYSTWGYHIFGPPDGTVRLYARLSTPPGWTILSRQPTIELVRGQTRVLPFTVWIPTDASADRHFEAKLELVNDDGEVMASATRKIEVAALYDITLRRVGELNLIADEQAKFVAEVRNNGNRTSRVRFRTESRHHWPVTVRPETVELSPGQTATVEVSITVPPLTRAGTGYSLTLDARIESEGLAFPPSEQVSISETVEAFQSPKSVYRRLPVRVQTSWETHESSGSQFGLRVSSEGEVSAQTRVGIEMDLDSGSPNKDSWRAQFLRVDLAQQNWKLSVGDVTGRLPEVATGTVSGRGFLWQGQRGAWRAHGFSARHRTQRKLSSRGFGIDRRFGPGLNARLDYVRQEREPTALLSAELVNLYTVSSTYRAGNRLFVTAEGSLSESNLPEIAVVGHGGHGELRYLDSRWSVRARAFAGDQTFRGRNRDRNGYLGHATFSLRSSLSLWASLDGSSGKSLQTDDPLRTGTRNQRLGLRLYPSRSLSVDVSLGRGRDEQSHTAQVLDVAKRDLVAMVWLSRGRVSLSATTRFGRTHNRIDDARGQIRGYGLTASRGWNRTRAVLGWRQEREEVPGTPEDRDATSLTGDISWNSLRGRLRLGMGVNSRTFATVLSSHQVNWETAYRPHLEARMSQHIRLRLEADLRASSVPLEFRQSRISLTWSADDAIPVVWSSIRGGIRTTVFVDENLDGHYNPGEETVSGVLLTIEGEQQISDDLGEAKWPPMTAGNYWLTLDRTSLPRDFIPMQSFPRFLSVTSGEDLTIYVPLARTCEVSGIIFHDRNHDSEQEAEESGVENVQITLLRDDQVIAQGMTDLTGQYRFDRLRPGQYQLRVEESRLPRDWVATGNSDRLTQLGREDRRTVQSFGVARKRRRIITTYHGGRDRSESELSPESPATDRD